jgi:hypothetical protein
MILNKFRLPPCQISISIYELLGGGELENVASSERKRVAMKRNRLSPDNLTGTMFTEKFGCESGTSFVLSFAKYAARSYGREG